MDTRKKVINALVDILKKDNEVHRCFAIRALGRMKAQEAISPLMACLTDEDEDVCIDSATALGKIGTAEAVNALLESNFDERDGDYTIAVIESLGNTNDIHVVNFLLQVLQASDQHQWDGEWNDWWDIQFKTIEVLGKIGHPKAISAIVEAIDGEETQELLEIGFKALASCEDQGIDELLKRLQHQQAIQRRRAINALSGIQPSRVKLALADTLKDLDPTVRLAGLDALVVTQNPSFFVQVRALLDDPDERVRERSLKLLENVKIDHPLEQLAFLLNDPSPLVRKQTIATLGKQQCSEAANQILEKVKDPDLEVSMTAIRVLGELKAAIAAEPLAIILFKTDWHPRCRAEAALALADLAGDQELRVLIHALEDSNRKIRINSLRAISKLDHPNKLSILLAALKGKLFEHPEEETSSLEQELPKEDHQINEQALEQDEKQDHIPHSTLEAISRDNAQVEKQQQKTVEMVELLEEEQEFLDIANTLKERSQESLSSQIISPHEDIQQFAAQLLSQIHDSRVVDALIDALTEGSPLVQAEAAEALGELRAKQAEPVLISLIESAVGEVNLKVIRALGKLKSKKVIAYLLEHYANESHLGQIEILRALRNCVDHADSDEQDQIFKIATEAVGNHSFIIRKIAGEVLAQIKNQDTIPYLIKLAFTAEGIQSSEVGKLLRKLDPEEASENLITILNDPSQYHHHHIAVQTLEEIHRI